MEYDGSDAGASPDEAISWGKIRMDAKPVKVCGHRWIKIHYITQMFKCLMLTHSQVHGDASLLFPLLVSQTFAKARE